MTIFLRSTAPVSAWSSSVYSPPSMSAASAKSLRATPPWTRTRLVATIAPRGDRSCTIAPVGGPVAVNVLVARRSARNQIVSPGW